MNADDKIQGLDTGAHIHIHVKSKSILFLEVKSVNMNEKTNEKQVYLKSLITDGLYEIKPNRMNKQKILTTPNGDKKEIINIRPAKEMIIQNEKVTNKYRPEKTDERIENKNSYRNKRTIDELESTSIETIGNCPVCDCMVVNTNRKVVCTGCGNWCRKKQWDRYNDKMKTPINGLQT